MSEGILLHSSTAQLIHTEPLSEVGQFRQWIFDIINPFIKGKVLELDCGNGYFTECFVGNGIQLELADPNSYRCRYLEDKFKKKEAVKDIHRINLNHETFETYYSRFFGLFDTVITLNTIDHIPNDKLAFSNAKQLLKKNGHLIALLPVKTALYNESEHGLREWKRYNRRSVNNLLSKDLESLKTQYFNIIGMVGWFLSKSQDKSIGFESKLANLYRRDVPLFRVDDEILFHRLGLSMIVIRKKTI